MKIKTYQWGGVYAPSPQTSPSTSSSSGFPRGSSAAPKTPFKDAVMKMLEKAGLPNDYRYTTNEVGALMAQMETLGGDYDPSMYTTVLQMVNEMSYHKDQYDGAVEAMSKIDAGEDIAMSNGRMYVVDKDGNLSTIKPTEFDPEKFQVLTNDDLLNVRSHSDKYKFNTNMLRDVANCTNMSTISEKIVKFARELAESEVTGYAHSNGKMKSIVEGADALMSEGPSGEYKFTTSEQINQKDIEAFVEYAYQNLLTDNEKSYLAADTVTSGGNPSSKKDLFNSLRTAVVFYTKHKTAVDFDPSATDERLGRRAAGSEKTGADLQLELAEIYATGEGASYTESTYFNITPEGANASMTAFGQNVGRIYKESGGHPGEALGYASFAKIMTEAYGIPKICGDAIWFGNQKVSGQDLNNIVYDNSSMYTAVLPARYENGDWKPDFETQDKIDSIMKNISNMDPSTIQTFVSQQIPGARYDARTNTIVPAQTHRFLVTSAIADSNYFDNLNTKSRYIEEMGRDEASLYRDYYKSSVYYGSGVPSSSEAKREMTGHGQKGWFEFGNHMYRANVFIPITSRMAGSTQYNQERVPKSSYMYASQRDLERERVLDARSAIASGQRRTNFNN